MSGWVGECEKRKAQQFRGGQILITDRDDRDLKLDFSIPAR
jgi:hypothetical protein